MRRLIPFALAVLAAITWAADKPKPASKVAVAAPAATEPSVPIVEARTQNVVEVASGSKDHSTLVAGLNAADYVRALANPGPFTVFAPTNAAFDKLPKGTLDQLLKPQSKEQLQNVLKYHVTTTAYELRWLKDGMQLGMANGAKVTFHVVDGKVMVNDATIIATIHAGNGNIHVIDKVLLPPSN